MSVRRKSPADHALLQASHGADAGLPEEVPVEIGGDLNRGVPELLADIFDALPLVDEQ
jgi:hypothetical protein